MAIATETAVESRPTFDPSLIAPSSADDSAAVAPHRRPRRRLLLTLALIAAAGAAIAAKAGVWSTNGTGVKTPMQRVSRLQIPITFSARGSLESGKNHEVVNRVEGQNRVIFLANDGSMVKKGELLIELDSSSLRDKLTTERITVQTAAAELQSAVKTREVAEFSLNEYEGGTYPSTKLDADIALKLAQTNLVQAAQRYEWSTSMYQKGLLARSQTVADRDSKANCEITLDRSQGKIAVLENYTKRKKIIELTAAVAKARSDELSKAAKLALEETKKKKYETLIERCKMFAPVDGLVVHNNEASMRPGSQQELLQEGSMARENQVLIRIPDAGSMRVNAKLDESIVSRVPPGSKAHIRVDALPGTALEGKVSAIHQMADSVTRETPEIRLYTALIGLDGQNPSLRPGMTAQVEIFVRESDPVVAVPAEAVLEIGDEAFVYVDSAQGPLRRGVRLGGGNGKVVEVAEGLAEGEVVSLEPMRLMTEDEKRQAFSVIANQAGDWH